MKSEDYQNELLQFVKYNYENIYRKNIEKNIKLMLIILTMHIPLLIYAILNAERLRNISLAETVYIAVILYTTGIASLMYMVLSAGKIKKNYVNSKFKKIMYNIQKRKPQEIIKNNTVFGIVYGSKKTKVSSIVEIIRINDRYYFRNRFHEYTIVLDTKEAQKIANKCKIKVQAKTRVLNYEYKFDQKLKTEITNYNLKIMFLDMILKNLIYVLLGVCYILILIIV